MSDFVRTAVVMFLVLNAPGVLGAFSALVTVPSERMRLVVTVMTATLAALAATALLSDTFLDLLDVSPEPFQLATGIVMLTLAGRLLVFGELGAPNLAPPFWAALSLELSPVAVVTMLGYAARYCTGTSLGAAALAVGLTGLLLIASPWLAQRLGSLGRGVLARSNGALIALFAVELMLDGIHSV